MHLQHTPGTKLVQLGGGGQSNNNWGVRERVIFGPMAFFLQEGKSEGHLLNKEKS